VAVEVADDDSSAEHAPVAMTKVELIVNDIWAVSWMTRPGEGFPRFGYRRTVDRPILADCSEPTACCLSRLDAGGRALDEVLHADQERRRRRHFARQIGRQPGGGGADPLGELGAREP